MKARLLAALLLLAAVPQKIVGSSPAMSNGRTVRLTVGQKARAAEVLFDGQKSGLLYYAEASYQVLWLDKDALAALQKAAQRYSDGFGRHSLKKTGGFVRAYGSVQTLLEWGSSRQSLVRRAPAKAALGYAFLSGSPYFCVSVQPVKSQAGEGPALQTSEPAVLLFTRSQLSAALSALLDEGLLGQARQ